MDANPILARFIRGNWLENRHRGAFCVANARGEVVASAGNVDFPVFPRSAIKAMQAIPMFETDSVTRFGLGSDSVALACASHHGEPAHVTLAAKPLAAIGLDVADLECGAHPPSNPEARKALAASGEKPTALHNNCSGKHAGMLSVARALGIDTHGYVARDHAVQKRVRAAVEAVLGEGLTEDRCGTDGCSIPTWAAPLKNFAAGFARMATGEGLSASHAGAARNIFDAIVAHPHLIAGTDSFDTTVIAAFEGRVITKIGAEGVFCGALRDKGLGFALKCDDGNRDAAIAMIAALLGAIASPDETQRAVLARFTRQPAKNWRGMEVGVLEAVPEIFAAVRL